MTCRGHTASCVAYLGHTGHASDQQHLSYVSFGHLGVLHGLLTGSHGAADQVTHNAFKLSASQLNVEMFGTGGIHGQVGKVDVSLEERINIMTSPLQITRNKLPDTVTDAINVY